MISKFFIFFFSSRLGMAKAMGFVCLSPLFVLPFRVDKEICLAPGEEEKKIRGGLVYTGI